MNTRFLPAEPRSTVTTIRWTPDEIQTLDRHATARGLPRATYVRLAVGRLISSESVNTPSTTG